MLHSGSRNIGNKLAQIHIKRAVEVDHKNRQGSPAGLEYFDLSSEEGARYLEDMTFALDFARENRFVMMSVIKDVLHTIFPSVKFGEIINIHHNYAAKENHFGEDIWVHRKGATKVTSGITGIIPGSMGSSSYLVKGTDNTESYTSCSHGAGRAMSRGSAKKTLTVESFASDMDGVYSENIDEHHLDEAPGAYKNINDVMQNQKDLVVIIEKLKPILNIKG